MKNEFNWHIDILSRRRERKPIASFLKEQDRDDCLTLLADKYPDCKFIVGEDL